MITYSLSAILTRVKAIIDEKTSGKSFWLKAEISNITFHKSGHCYIDLVETKDNNVIAQCKATIWASNISSIQHELQSDFNIILKKGNEFLCEAQISFHQLYGLQINILKVDISFSLGNLEKIKQETIDRLKDEGVFDTNKLKIPPVVIKRIALITSISTSAYSDFYKQIKQNQYGYQFEIFDFNVTVQGDKAVDEICQRLEYLNNQKFDIVAIIRGGGSKLDLDVFNKYTLAKTIATHNLPIYTGIGHETDVNVADMVSSMSHKTPTALGAYIVEQAHNFDVMVNNLWKAIKEFQNLYFETQSNWLNLNIQTLTSESISKTRLRRGDLHTVQTRINTEVMDKINVEKGKLIDAIAFIRSDSIFKTQRKRGDLHTVQNRINKIVMDILNVENGKLIDKKAFISSQPVFLVSNKKQSLKNTVQLIHVNFQSKVKQSIDGNNFVLHEITTRTKLQCEEKRKHMSNIMEVVKIYHPSNIMRKGYAIPRYRGKLYSNQPLKPKEELELELLNQTLVVSFIKSKRNG